MKIACGNLHELQGRYAFLTDNSGSAWDACTSEWGTMQVAEIGNLSSVISAMCAEEGAVFPFGDALKSITIHKDKGILEQAQLVSHAGRQCGTTKHGMNRKAENLSSSKMSVQVLLFEETVFIKTVFVKTVFANTVFANIVFANTVFVKIQ